MELPEHAGKRLFASCGLPVPIGHLVNSPDAARAAAEHLGGRVAVKCQVPAGRRGKAGGIALVDTAAAAAQAAGRLIGAEIAGHRVTELLVEERLEVVRELYAAVVNDGGTKGPLLLFSSSGGVDIEDVEATTPDRVHRLPVDIRVGIAEDGVRSLLERPEFAGLESQPLVDALHALYAVYRRYDAELVEINPLAVARDGAVVALDSKVALDPGALPRHAEIGELSGGRQPEGTPLERAAREQGLALVELGGNIAVLANGAGLTMTTLDAVHHFGGRPANFLEIGGDAYTKALPAMRLILALPGVRSLLINFCGAFARTDVMTQGVVAAIEELRPEIPVFFSIHGTGEEEAIRLVRDRLGMEPYDLMDDAVRAAIAATGPRVEPTLC